MDRHDERKHPGTGEHLQRNSVSARNWIFGLIAAAVLLMMFAKTPDADAWLYELTNSTRDRGEMLSDKQWDDLHNTLQ